MALIDVEVVDKDGNRCPTALNMINFDLTGPAEWRGGIAQGPENYILSKSLPVEGGVNRVLLRSTTKAGKIVLGERAAGLKSAADRIDLKTIRLNERSVAGSAVRWSARQPFAWADATWRIL